MPENVDERSQAFKSGFKNIQYKFITNNTTSSRLKLLNKLKNLGLSTEKENIISANFAGVLFFRKNWCKIM